MDFKQFRKICGLEEFYLMLEDGPKIALLCMSAAIHKVKHNSCWEFIEVLSHLFHFCFIKISFGLRC
jgi:hypothetical protein